MFRLTSLATALLSLFMLSAPASAYEAITGPLGLLAYDKAKAYDGYTLFTPHTKVSSWIVDKIQAPGSRKTYLIDMEGNIVHTWKHDHPAFYAELLPNGNLLRAEKIAGSPVNFGGWYGLLREYAWDGKVVWEYKVSNPRQIAHHGFDRLPNGNTAILIWENKTYDEALAKGRDPKDKALSRNGMPAPGQGPDGQPLQGIWPDAILEVTPKGEIAWEWHVWDNIGTGPDQIDINWHLPLSMGYFARADWTHWNSVRYNAKTDQYAVNSRDFGEIYIIDRKTKKIVWRYGNPATHGMGKAPSGYHDDGDQVLFGSHDVEWLKGTDVSVDTLKKETNEAGIQMENMKFDYNYNNMKENTRETVEEVQVREFKKSSKLNNVLYDVRGPVVEEAARMENAGTQVLKLNIGNPAPFGFRTPDEVIYDMRQQLTECEGYSPAKGLFSARKAIMQYAQLKKLPNVSIEDIYTGNGVSELINLCMSALLDNGDEILIPSPDYPLWTACATLAGGKAVHYICDEQAEWYPDMDDIRKKITSRTKAIVIINPNNPTGALYPREILQQIVDIAREHHLIIFSDEIYDRLVMDGAEHISIASMAPDLFCVTFSGLSKSHMIAGFRIGWMILSGNKAVAKDYIEGIKMLSNMRLCSNVPAQSIVQTALGGHQSVESYIVPGGRIYEQREFIYNALTDIPGITAVKPKAAFYMFPKIDTKKFNIVNDEKFALDLLKEKKILLVHGGGFNWHQPDHFRVVYLPRIEVLKEAAGKIRDFLEYYQQEI